jgi:2-polyprenyl-3-methyl-5-hydroxy-6-metoxy-1,4-benzoquinol methylase
MSESYFTHARPEMQPFVPEAASRVLDIGCGAGAFGAALKELRPHLTVTGVEIDPEAAESARSRLDLVLTGDAESALPRLQGQSFDAIVLNDVLEHVVDPEELLRQLSSLIARGGCVVASIPNVREFFTVKDLALRGRWEYADEGILDRTHLRFFTRSSIAGLFERGGFSVERVEGINQTGSSKFKLFNLITLGRFSEMGFLQFACVARPRN